jgi:CRISPR system Cascade subunit CasE
MNLWLTRIRPDMDDRRAQTDLRDALEMHRTTMRMFPDGLGDHPRKRASVLFRVDDDATGPFILVQSAIKPEPERLPASYGTVECKSLAPVLERLRPGLRLHYRISAHAVRRISRTSPRPDAGKTLTLTGEAADRWWHDRAAAAGLALHTLHRDHAATARGDYARTGPLHLTRQWFHGTATVTDETLLRHHLANGIGRAKNYGCGLLTLAPAQ